jgi:glycosyltransferase involved in cell wall biosynthesis
VVARVKTCIALDLDGSLESLGNTMKDLATALGEIQDLDLRVFHSNSRAKGKDELRIGRRRWRQLRWRQGRGKAFDRVFPNVNLVHVAGEALPPTKSIPLVISIDDLRPLRPKGKDASRIKELQRALNNGATLVVSTRTGSHEVQRTFKSRRNQVVSAPPVVPIQKLVTNGDSLVVNVAGGQERLLARLPEITAFASSVGAEVMILGSKAVNKEIRGRVGNVRLLPRTMASETLQRARVVIDISDGARFPSFCVAALSAGVPTMARASDINHEVLGGSAALVEPDESFTETLRELWHNESKRKLLVAAGRERAKDFEPQAVAHRYHLIYRDVLRDYLA